MWSRSSNIRFIITLPLSRLCIGLTDIDNISRGPNEDYSIMSVPSSRLVVHTLILDKRRKLFHLHPKKVADTLLETLSNKVYISSSFRDIIKIEIYSMLTVYTEDEIERGILR